MFISSEGKRLSLLFKSNFAALEIYDEKLTSVVWVQFYGKYILALPTEENNDANLHMMRTRLYTNAFDERLLSGVVTFKDSMRTPSLQGIEITRCRFRKGRSIYVSCDNTRNWCSRAYSFLEFRVHLCLDAQTKFDSGIPFGADFSITVCKPSYFIFESVSSLSFLLQWCKQLKSIIKMVFRNRVVLQPYETHGEIVKRFCKQWIALKH